MLKNLVKLVSEKLKINGAQVSWDLTKNQALKY